MEWDDTGMTQFVCQGKQIRSALDLFATSCEGRLGRGWTLILFFGGQESYTIGRSLRDCRCNGFTQQKDIDV